MQLRGTVQWGRALVTRPKAPLADTEVHAWGRLLLALGRQLGSTAAECPRTGGPGRKDLTSSWARGLYPHRQW